MIICRISKAACSSQPNPTLALCCPSTVLSATTNSILSLQMRLFKRALRTRIIRLLLILRVSPPRFCKLIKIISAVRVVKVVWAWIQINKCIRSLVLHIITGIRITLYLVHSGESKAIQAQFAGRGGSNMAGNR